MTQRAVEVLDEGQRLRLEEDNLYFDATQINITDGVIRAVVTVGEGPKIWHRDGPISLTSASRRAQFLGRLATLRGTALPDGLDPLLTLDEAVRADGLGCGAPPGGSHGNGFEHSNTPCQVECTPQLTELLANPHLFEHLSNALGQQGWVGNRRPPLMAHLALTSRLLEHPINLAFVALSASGKNRAIEAALGLMPPEAYYLERAGSERALIYSCESFERRVVIFWEADSIVDDGPVASAIRSLASDNLLTYDVVEQNPSTNRFETRRIEKPGPTGLITTSTRSLQAQLGTRVLELGVSDQEAQTRRIMRAQAARVGLAPTPASVAQIWIDLQRHLAATGPHRIVIPFAAVLAESVPATAVRMRRDFPQLLSAIQAVALLHLQQRPRAADGAIIASLRDYWIARALLAPIFDAVRSGGLTPAIRETIAAVPVTDQIDQAISQTALAERLSIEKSTVSWRVRRALRGGWLKNLETRKRRPARLVRGDSLPDTVTALPTVRALRQAFDSCSSGVRIDTSAVSDSADTSCRGAFECSNGNPGEPLSPGPTDGRADSSDSDQPNHDDEY